MEDIQGLSLLVKRPVGRVLWKLRNRKDQERALEAT